jgi:hypothetical protein
MDTMTAKDCEWAIEICEKYQQELNKIIKIPNLDINRVNMLQELIKQTTLAIENFSKDLKK